MMVRLLTYLNTTLSCNNSIQVVKNSINNKCVYMVLVPSVYTSAKEFLMLIFKA